MPPLHRARRRPLYNHNRWGDMDLFVGMMQVTAQAATGLIFPADLREKYVKRLGSSLPPPSQV